MTKKLLILGSGGREHALAKRLGLDEQVEKVFVMPGNPGMQSDVITCVEGSVKNFEFIHKFVVESNVDLVVVGPEEPLVAGIVDYLSRYDICVLGPTQAAAQLEGSKAFSKDFMQEFAIPTAKYRHFSNYEMAREDLQNNHFWDKGVVVKASSLAAGKGVLVCKNREEALDALYNIMINDKFSVKSDTVVLEQLLYGKELSAFALCDGETFIPLGYACDHKRLLDNDQGPNTGGMGTYTPQNWPSAKVKEAINQKVFQKVIDGMKRRGTPFKGILFAGLMIDDLDVNVIEFNVRFGDPEAQVLMPMLQGNLCEHFMAAAQGKLEELKSSPLNLLNKVAIHVVKVTQGYPALNGEQMLKNQIVEIDQRLAHTQNAQLFYAGVGKQGDYLVNTGGRVLGVTAVGNDLDQARKEVYQCIDYVNFNGAFWRRDIGSK